MYTTLQIQDTIKPCTLEFASLSPQLASRTSDTSLIIPLYPTTMLPIFHASIAPVDACMSLEKMLAVILMVPSGCLGNGPVQHAVSKQQLCVKQIRYSAKCRVLTAAMYEANKVQCKMLSFNSSYV